MVTKNCEQCGKGYSVYPFRAATSRFCSRSCKAKVKLGRIERKPKGRASYHAECQRCGKVFTVDNHYYLRTRRYCSISCANRGRKDRMAKTCEECGQVFNVEPGRFASARFCSHGCKVAAQVGKPMLMRRARRQANCDECGGSFEVAPSNQKARFCKRACKDKWWARVRTKPITPEMSPHKLRHLISASAEYQEWRFAVFNRDKRTCRRCEEKNHQLLRAHHVNPVSTHPELMFDVDNGLTLCQSCHEQVHREMPKLWGKSRLREYLTSIRNHV